MGWKIMKNKRKNQNYEGLLVKIKATLNLWRRRNLSLIGKINIVNTLIGSLFVYKMMVLPTIDSQFIKLIESEIISFLWNNKKAKISLRTMQASKELAGLRLVDLYKKDLSIKIGWVKILHEEEDMRNLVMTQISPLLDMWIFECELEPQDVDHLKIESAFWRDVMYAWATFNKNKNKGNKRNKDNKGITDVLLWWNSKIRIENKPFIWPHAVKRGLYKVSQLFENKLPITIEEAKQRFDLTYMQYHALMAAIPRELKNKLRSDESVSWTSKYADVLDKKDLTRSVYMTLIQECPRSTYLQNKWENLLVRDVSIEEICKEFKKIQATTNVPKYRSFQYRLMHNALVTNIQLFHWKFPILENVPFAMLVTKT